MSLRDNQLSCQKALALSSRRDNHHPRRDRQNDHPDCRRLPIQIVALHGYQAFVVADACWAVDKVDLRGKRWPAEDVHALSLAHLEGEYATIVDTMTTLRAAATAKARQRRGAGRA